MVDKCNILLTGGGDWRCTTCGISGDRDEEPEDFCQNKPMTATEVLERQREAAERRPKSIWGGVSKEVFDANVKTKDVTHEDRRQLLEGRFTDD